MFRSISHWWNILHLNLSKTDCEFSVSLQSQVPDWGTIGQYRTYINIEKFLISTHVGESKWAQHKFNFVAALFVASPAWYFTHLIIVNGSKSQSFPRWWLPCWSRRFCRFRIARNWWLAAGDDLMKFYHDQLLLVDMVSLMIYIYYLSNTESIICAIGQESRLGWRIGRRNAFHVVSSSSELSGVTAHD